jgi:cytochrome c-type biogenesis protein CcmH/NrfF
VLAMLARHDLLDAAQRKAAYDEVVAWYTARFGGEHALIVPEKEKSGQVGWMVPVVMVVAGLGLLYAIGRRWVVRGRRAMAERRSAVAAAEAPENEDYADRLDDELRETD